MTELSKTILDHWQVRKTKKQKTAFIEFMQSHFPEMKVEQGGFCNNRNLVIGDVKSADVILGAHYDTCTQLPFPNFISPKNIPLYVLYSLAICIPFAIVALGINALLHLITNDFFLLYWGTFLPTMALMILIFMAGKPNRHTVNDNTSGVITLCEIWAAMSQEQRAKTAFVFFDNEENGLLGSAYFRSLHKKDDLGKKLMINYDCVSDGENMLFVLNKPARSRYGEAFAAAFPSTADHMVWIENAASTMYPSDQGNFPVSVGVAALKKKKGIGLYMDRIHTSRDTVLREENITYLTSGTLDLIEKIRSV